MQDDLERLNTRALTDLIGMSTGLPVKPAKNGAQVKLNERWCLCQVDFAQFTETETGCLASGYVKLELTQDEIVEDVITGAGKHVGHAAISVVQQFVSGIIKTVAAASHQIVPVHSGHEDDVAVSSVKCNGREWTVSLSQAITNDTIGTLNEIVDAEPPMWLCWDTIVDFLQLKNPTPHWFKLYMCNFPDGEIDGEFKVDNYLSESGMKQMMEFPWPETRPEPLWFRQFAYFEPAGYFAAQPLVVPQSENWISKFLR